MIHPKNLLIVRTDRIGDVVLSLPLAGIIKKHYPDCKVTFLLREYTESLAKNNPNIDEIITLLETERKISLMENVRKLKEHKFDSCIVVYPTFITSLIIFLTGIKERIGTGYRWYSVMFNHKIFTHRKFAGKHELEFNVEMLKEFGISEIVNTQNIIFNLSVSSESKVKIESILEQNGISNKNHIIIIHPGSGGSAIDLPITKLKELIKLILENLDVKIILTGNESEKNLCETLKLSDKILNFAGLLELSELIALIDESDIFIANSTGPLHIAAALGKYVIGFYPKILACSAERWGPYTNKSFVFKPEIDCRDCTREQCTRLDCMNSININNVFTKVKEVHKILINNGEFND